MRCINSWIGLWTNLWREDPSRIDVVVFPAICWFQRCLFHPTRMMISVGSYNIFLTIGTNNCLSRPSREDFGYPCGSSDTHLGPGASHRQKNWPSIARRSHGAITFLVQGASQWLQMSRSFLTMARWPGISGVGPERVRGGKWWWTEGILWRPFFEQIHQKHEALGCRDIAYIVHRKQCKEKHVVISSWQFGMDINWWRSALIWARTCPQAAICQAIVSRSRDLLIYWFGWGNQKDSSWIGYR